MNIERRIASHSKGVEFIVTASGIGGGVMIARRFSERRRVGQLNHPKENKTHLISEENDTGDFGYIPRSHRI